MIKREVYMKKLRPFVNTDIIKVLTGIRRCGKSVMLELIIQELSENGVSNENFIYINFEDVRNQNLCEYMSLHDFVSEKIKFISGKVYLFLDEIQEVIAWEKCVNSLRVNFDIDIYVTGSNAKLLSGELATYIAGRYVQFTIYPFSFREIVELTETAEGKKVDMKDLFLKYILKGGMPFLYQFPVDSKSGKQYLSDIYDSIIVKDIIKRNKVRDVDLFKRIMLFFMSNISNTFSADSIIKYLKNEKRNISTETIYNYLNYCKDACLLHLVQREDIKGKRLLQFSEKIFITDHGLRDALLESNMQDINAVLENIIYMELCARGYKVNIGKLENREIDFIARRSSEVLYIQVTYLLASEETIEREFLPLRKIKNNYPKYVLSMDDINFSQDGIKHMRIEEFLLE